MQLRMRIPDTMMTDFNKKTQISMQKMMRYPGYICRKTWKLGRDDPRRLIHAFKVGFSLTLVSLLYLMEPLFKGVGKKMLFGLL
ncbi:putative aluminum-activated malate transporter [Helianthus anomalus]